MKQQLQRALAAVQTTTPDLQGLLGGNGGSQVDVILYLLSAGKEKSQILGLRCIVLMGILFC